MTEAGHLNMTEAGNLEYDIPSVLPMIIIIYIDFNGIKINSNI